jgi:hypothetical protein
MNQVDRRRREQLLPEELALLKSCGGEIRKTDREAMKLVRARCGLAVGKTTSGQRVFKAHWTLTGFIKGLARKTWLMLKADAPHLSRRHGHF